MIPAYWKSEKIMTIKLYNIKNRKKEVFKPIDAKNGVDAMATNG